MEKYYLQDEMPFECYDWEVSKALIKAKVGEWKYVAQIRMDPVKLINAVVYFASATGMQIQFTEDYSAFRKIEEFTDEYDFLLKKDLDY